MPQEKTVPYIYLVSLGIVGDLTPVLFNPTAGYNCFGLSSREICHGLQQKVHDELARDIMSSFLHT